MMEWRAGMEAVFVGWPSEMRLNPSAPDYTEGKVYTVEEVFLARRGDTWVNSDGSHGRIWRDAVYIRVLGWLAISTAFRPVVKRKTDISVFQELRRGIEQQMDKLKEFERTHPL